ncbi:MAG: multicopper oxidase family protein [Rhodospirillales bacterium]|nr:MAG: multicopper oxidase family protein [Rhodospirillales bacterium]
MTLTAAPTTVSLVGGEWPDTATWAYNGTVPGPEIRVRQGDTVRVVARNNLAEPTTVHWHGIRLPNAMDGVPGVTQDAIPPGEEFLYEFEAIDAGSFWYHPHFNSPEQQGRGLAGALIVEEAEPLAVDRDVTWVLDDWLLRETAQIDDSFGHRGQMSHGGRIGNTVTVNGRIPDVFGVRAGERIRLRLINVANARSFSIDFGDLKPQIIALDGQPVRPHAPSDGSVVVAAAQRVDLVIDMEGKPGDVVQLTDGYYRGRTYEFHKLVYEATPPLRESPLDAPITLAANPLPEPVLDDSAMRQRIVLEGGAMGRFPAGAERFFEQGQFWFVNGLPDKGRKEPLIEIAKGRTCVIELVNQTSWEHPMHLHGFAFRVLTRDGVPNMRKEWLDTVLIRPRQSIEIAFVADSPGDWLFHCHILEHMAAGMSGLVRVA